MTAPILLLHCAPSGYYIEAFSCPGRSVRPHGWTPSTRGRCTEPAHTSGATTTHPRRSRLVRLVSRARVHHPPPSQETDVPASVATARSTVSKHSPRPCEERACLPRRSRRLPVVHRHHGRARLRLIPLGPSGPTGAPSMPHWTSPWEAARRAVAAAAAAAAVVSTYRALVGRVIPIRRPQRHHDHATRYPGVSVCDHDPPSATGIGSTVWAAPSYAGPGNGASELARSDVRNIFRFRDRYLLASRSFFSSLS